MTAIKPPEERRNRAKPLAEFQTAPGVGWQHGKPPPCPTGLNPAAQRAWQTWMKAWFAAFWWPDDLPGLAVVAQLYDRCATDPTSANASALRQWLDAYGITAKGQQRLRWRRGEAVAPTPPPKRPSRYTLLRVAGGDDAS